MNFQVKPESVDAYGSLIERNGVNLSLANVHLAKHMSLDPGDGFWMSVVIDQGHRPAVERMSDSLYRGFNAMGASAEQLKLAAKHYRTTDQQSAADLDSSYSASPRPPVESPDQYRPPHLEGQAGPFASGPGVDVVDPTAFLNAPSQPREFTNLMAIFDAVSDLFSPSWWLNQVIAETTGFNPMDEVVKKVVGNWEGYARCAIVWEDLSKAVGAISENIEAGLTWLATDWQGHASDAAVHYFDYLRRALDSHQQALRILHDKYIDVARGVWQFAKAATDILKAFLDTLIMIGVTSLASIGLSWTGIGEAVSLSVGAFEIKRLLGLWQELTGLITSTENMFNGFIGWIQQMDVNVGVAAMPMPATDYHYPMAKPEKTGPRMKGETL